MASVICLQPPPIPTDLTLNLPGVGELQFLKGAIDNIPRPSTYILGNLNNINVFLSPVRAFLRIVGVIQAIVDCINAIKDAVSQLSPGPIIDCFEGLFARLAELIELFPPFVYLRLISGILQAVLDLLRDLLVVIEQIDAQISAIKSAIARAVEIDDTTLLSVGNCAQQEMQSIGENFGSAFEAIGLAISAIGAILNLMASLIPGPIGNELKKAALKLTDVEGQIGEISITDFPPLGLFADIILDLYDAVKIMKNAVDAALGSLESIPDLIRPPLENP